MPLLRDVPDKPVLWPPASERNEVWSALAYARQRDPWGHLVHTALACLYLFLLPLTTAPKDGAFIALAVYAILRLHCTAPACVALFRDPVVQIFLALSTWHAISLAWTSRLDLGLEDLRAFRVVFTPFLIWPVIDRAGWLLGAFLLGVLAQNGVQVMQELRLFDLRRRRGRLPGLIHPIDTATMCAAAICWHLSAILQGRRWLRAASVVGLVAAAGGLVFSGSRGPWIGAAMALALFLPITAWRRSDLRRPLLIVTVFGLLVTLAAGFMARDIVTKRVQEAWTDLVSAREGEYDTNLGVRLALWDGAWQVFLDAPVVGVGAGDVNEEIRAVRPDVVSADEGHAHSTYLQVLAATGLVGAVLLIAMLALILRRAFTVRDDTPWSLGTAYALIAWLVAGQFDAYHLNGHTFGLLAFIATLTISTRPPRSTDPFIPRPSAPPAPGPARDAGSA